MTVLRLLNNLRDHARRQPDAPAVCAAGSAQTMSYAALAERADVVAAHLRDRFPTGSVVLLRCPNQPDYLCAFLAVLAAGCTIFPVPPDATPAEVSSAARSSGAAAAICAEPSLGGFDRAEPLSPLNATVLATRAPWQPRVDAGAALLLQSSGTTGLPKLVRRDAAALDAVSANMVHSCRFTASDHILATVPLCHSYGLEHGLLAPLWAGSCVHLCDGFNLPVVLRELREGGITLMPGVPFMFEALCRAGGGLFPDLRRAYSAGGPLPREVYERFLETYGIRVTQLYGATEVGSVTYNDPDDAGFDPVSVGTPMRGVSVRVVDVAAPRIDEPLPTGAEGQVAIRAPSMLSGYLDEEPAPLLDGHFLTGDLARIDARGALTITGRLKLLIDIGGRKVNPAEVEGVLRQHPLVGECVVVSMRVSETVNRLKAVVAPADSHHAPATEDLRAFCRERLTLYKVPRVFEVRDALPTSPAGKVLRHLVEAP